MRPWRMLGEPSLDELLDDEVIFRVMRRDGLDESELRRLLVEMAGRLAAQLPRSSRSCCSAVVG